MQYEQFWIFNGVYHWWLPKQIQTYLLFLTFSKYIVSSCMSLPCHPCHFRPWFNGLFYPSWFSWTSILLSWSSYINRCHSNHQVALRITEVDLFVFLKNFPNNWPFVNKTRLSLLYWTVKRHFGNEHWFIFFSS